MRVNAVDRITHTKTSHKMDRQTDLPIDKQESKQRRNIKEKETEV